MFIDFGWKYCLKQAEIERYELFQSWNTYNDNFIIVRKTILGIYEKKILPEKEGMNAIEKLLYFFKKDNLTDYIKSYRDGNIDWFKELLELCSELKNVYRMDELYVLTRPYNISGLEFFARIISIEKLIHNVIFKYKSEELTDEIINNLIERITKGSVSDIYSITNSVRHKLRTLCYDGTLVQKVEYIINNGLYEREFDVFCL